MYSSSSFSHIQIVIIFTLAPSSKLALFSRKLDTLHDKTYRKKKSYVNNDDDELAAPHLKQGYLDVPILLSQHLLDQCVVDYIVQSILPVHHIDSPGFNKYTGRLTSGRLFPSCGQAVTNHLEATYEERKLELKKNLALTDGVYTTADCWSSRWQFLRLYCALD